MQNAKLFHVLGRHQHTAQENSLYIPLFHPLFNSKTPAGAILLLLLLSTCCLPLQLVPQPPRELWGWDHLPTAALHCTHRCPTTHSPREPPQLWFLRGRSLMGWSGYGAQSRATTDKSVTSSCDLTSQSL